VVRERLIMSVIVGRSTGRHCFRIDVGIGSRSQKVLDDCMRYEFREFSLETGVKSVRLGRG